MLSRKNVAPSTMSRGSTCIFILRGFTKITLIDSPNFFFISSTSPFSNGGASGSFFGGGAPAAGFGAAGTGSLSGVGGFSVDFCELAAIFFGSSLFALLLLYLLPFDLFLQQHSPLDNCL